MTSLLATRRRAEEFARLVDEKRHTHDPNLAHLLAVTSRLSPASIEPSPEFRTALRDRLVTAASEAGTASPTPESQPATPAPAARTVRPATRLRWVAVATSVVVASGMVGTAAAARTAMPGDELYGIKLGLERTEAAIATNDQSRGRAYLTQAEQRLAEVTALVDGSSVSADDEETIRLINAALDDFVRHSQEGGGLLLDVYAEEERAAVLGRLGGFTAESLAELERVEELLPDPSLDAHGKATDMLRGFENRLLVLCPGCLALPEEPSPAEDLQGGGDVVGDGEAAGHGGAGHGGEHEPDDSEDLVAGDVAPAGDNSGDQQTEPEAALNRRPGQQPEPGDSRPDDPRRPDPAEPEPDAPDLPLPLPDLPEPTTHPEPDDPAEPPEGPEPRPTIGVPTPVPTTGEDEADSGAGPLPLTLPLPLPTVELPHPLESRLELPLSARHTPRESISERSVDTSSRDESAPSPDDRSDDQESPSPSHPENTEDPADPTPAPSPDPTTETTSPSPDPTEPTQSPTPQREPEQVPDQLPTLPLPTNLLAPN